LADNPLVKVLMLSTFDADNNVIQALKAGASGYVLKDSQAKAIVSSILAVVAGERVMASAVANRVLEMLTGVTTPKEFYDGALALIHFFTAVVVVPGPVARNGASSRLVVDETPDLLLIDHQPLFLAALESLLTAPPVRARVHIAADAATGMEIALRGQVNLVFCEVRSEPLPAL